MADFYADWLAASERADRAVHDSPVVARGTALNWIETPQDHRIAMLIGDQVGFPTQGTSLVRMEIPRGKHSGKHVHGEEAIHVVSGSGFSVIAGRRYDWHAGSTIHVPYMAEHQHFNTGPETAALVSAASMDLDLFGKLGRLIQLEEKGDNPPDLDARIPVADSQFDAEGRRIVLHLEDAPDETRRRAERRAAEGNGRDTAHGSGHDHGAGTGHGAGKGHGPKEESAHRHGAIYILMGGGESPSDERNGFTAVSVAMTNIFEEVPHTSSHKHSHTEAILYVLEGVGYSEIDGQRYDWRAGDAVHVPPKMTVHEHFNPSDVRTRTLRIEFGIRYFYEGLWSGYHKVEHRLEAIARP